MFRMQTALGLWICLFVWVGCQTSPTVTPIVEQATLPAGSPTPTSLFNMPALVPTPQITWTTKVKEITRVNGPLAWSPIANEFASGSYCPRFPDWSLVYPFVFIASAPNFTHQNITIFPEDFCYISSDLDWSPDGKHILWISFGDEGVDQLFITNRDDLVSLKTNANANGRLLNFKGWLTNNTFVYSEYLGGSNSNIYIFDITSNKEMARSRIHGGITNTSKQYAVGMEERYCGAMTAIAISTTPSKIDPMMTENLGEYVNLLSFQEDPWQHLFNSYLQDWTAESNQMLVLTWEKEVDTKKIDLLHDTPITDLQVWDVATDELTMLVPNSIYGRVSPDRQYLIYLTPAQTLPQLHIVDRATGETIFNESIYAEAAYCVINAFTSFSPDGRYLTFYVSDSELFLYDLQERVLSAPLPASFPDSPPFTPVWSPTSQHFIYRDPTHGLALFDVEHHIGFPLTTNDIRFTNPQWSYDGQYLSVSTSQSEGSQTVVLQMR